MLRPKYFAILAATALLAACGESGETAEDTALPTMYRSAQPTATETENRCGGHNFEDTMEAVIDQIPNAPNGQEWGFNQTNTYDPCLEFSWMQLYSDPNDLDSYSQILLFQGPHFVGTAESFNTTAAHVQRIDDTTIKVMATASDGAITATFVWNAVENTIEKYPETPIEEDIDATVESTTSATTMTPTIAAGEGKAVVFAAINSRIRCAMFTDRLLCHIRQVAEQMPTDEQGNQYNTLAIQDGAAMRIYSENPAAWWRQATNQSNQEVQILNPNDEISYSYFTCSNTFQSIDCVDNSTGAGAKVSLSNITLY
ncbi:MAG: LppP/LprE family lipoprotein [Corynebacterium sp.]|nr:LppP/LprE family lipoprotein [Corynebacterium sp.]